MFSMKSENSLGSIAPAASETVTVVAPALIAASIILYKNSESLLVASSAINSMLSVYFLQYSIVSTTFVIILSAFR